MEILYIATMLLGGGGMEGIAEPSVSLLVKVLRGAVANHSYPVGLSLSNHLDKSQIF